MPSPTEQMLAESVPIELKKRLLALADKYEVASFTNEDPSQILRWYKPDQVPDTEAASFIAAMLAFGSRKQFIPKIRQILQTADFSSGSITLWLKSGAFKKDFPIGPQKFYRFYSYDDFHVFFGELADILNKTLSLGESLREQFERMMKEADSSNQASLTTKSSDPSKNERTSKVPALSPNDLIMNCFAQSFQNSAIVPKGKNSANKRIHMFLRWMVRQNSPVDLGLWTWFNPADLLIPLDVHVMQEAVKLGLLPENSTASRKTAILLTNKLAQIFPNDPCRADFALFGLGVDTNDTN